MRPKQTHPMPHDRLAKAAAEGGAKEKVLAIATELFYREGVRAVGVDTIVEKSGVAKTSLYRWFPSKDHLVAAFLEEQHRWFCEWWDRNLALHAGAPREQLRAQLREITEYIGSRYFRGCPFLNTATEFPDEKIPGRAHCQTNKQELHRRLRDIVSRIGVQAPERVANQLVLLVEGAFAHGHIFGKGAAIQELVAAADTIVDANLKRRRA
jgi:AcrR family transcriptional regulator